MTNRTHRSHDRKTTQVLYNKLHRQMDHFSLPLSVYAVQAYHACNILFSAQEDFPINHHNELRDLTAHLLPEVCQDERTEPDLLPLTGKTLSHNSAKSLHYRQYHKNKERK